MPPIAIAAGIGAVGAIGGAVISNKGASKAAKTQADSNAQNVALQRDIYGQNKAALAPWQQSGLAANSLYTSALGIPGGNPAAAQSAFDTFRNSTGYQFRMNQGQDAVNSGYAGAGLVRSGAAMRALDDYRQNMASAEFGNWMGALEGTRNLGFGAASAQAGVGQSFANNVSSLNAANANSQAQYQIAKAQNTAGALGAVGQLGAYAYGSIYNPQNQVFAPMPQGGWGSPGYY